MKITRKLIKETIKLEFLSEQDYNYLEQFLKDNLLKSIIIKRDNLVIQVLKILNKKYDF